MNVCKGQDRARTKQETKPTSQEPVKDLACVTYNYNKILKHQQEKYNTLKQRLQSYETIKNDMEQLLSRVLNAEPSSRVVEVPHVQENQPLPSASDKEFFNKIINMLQDYNTMINNLQATLVQLEKSFKDSNDQVLELLKRNFTVQPIESTKNDSEIEKLRSTLDLYHSNLKTIENDNDSIREQLNLTMQHIKNLEEKESIELSTDTTNDTSLNDCQNELKKAQEFIQNLQEELQKQKLLEQQAREALERMLTETKESSKTSLNVTKNISTIDIPPANDPPPTLTPTAKVDFDLSDQQDTQQEEEILIVQSSFPDTKSQATQTVPFGSDNRMSRTSNDCEANIKSLQPSILMYEKTIADLKQRHIIEVEALHDQIQCLRKEFKRLPGPGDFFVNNKISLKDNRLYEILKKMIFSGIEVSKFMTGS